VEQRGGNLNRREHPKKKGGRKNKEIGRRGKPCHRRGGRAATGTIKTLVGERDWQRVEGQ